MKDAASILAMDVWMTIAEEQNGGRSKFAARIRSAIRRAVKAERERCVGIIQQKSSGGTMDQRVTGEAIVRAIQAKRPSRKRK
jgi:hypothetical protein